MLAAAALVPETLLLVPGAAGGADVLGTVRAAALEAVAVVLAVHPDRLVVVAPGRADRAVAGPVRAALGAAGVPDAAPAWEVPPAPQGAPTVGVAAGVGLLLAHRAGWPGAVDVVEVGPADPGDPARPQRLREGGAALAAGSRLGLVVLGSGSARHGPAAPLVEDPRATAFDETVTADLGCADATARRRLAGLDQRLAVELVVGGWGPWQVLLGAAAAAPVQPRLLQAGAPLGAWYVVATWVAGGRP